MTLLDKFREISVEVHLDHKLYQDFHSDVVFSAAQVALAGNHQELAIKNG